MPLKHNSKVYAVTDCKIARLTSDPDGGAAVYGTSIDVPGIKSMEIGGDINSSELRGDNSLLDQTSTIGSVTVSVEHAKVSLDVLNILLGGTVTDAGVAPNQTSTFSLGRDSTPQYFRIEGKTPANGSDFAGGDVHFVLYKCIVSSFPDLGFAEEDYRTVSFEAVALPRLADGKQLDAVFNETAVAIA